MKQIRLYLVLAIIFVLTGLYAFRNFRTKEKKKTAYQKTLSVPAFLQHTAGKQEEGMLYTVQGIYAGGTSVKEGYRILLEADQTTIQLECLIRSEQSLACQQIRKGSELVVSGTYSHHGKNPVLRDAVLISENIADTLHAFYSY